MVVPIFDLLVPLERITIFTPLGIRFWDAARDIAVSDDLTVTARPQTRPTSITRAFSTAAGVYAFQGLPGLRDVEYPSGDLGHTPGIPAMRRFIVEVTDGQRRFLPVAFGVDVPYHGIFPTAVSGSPLGSKPPGFYLFSAPTRPATAGLAVVRAQLEDQSSQRAAAYAVLEIHVSHNQTWYGVADERGSVAVMFPYPAFAGTMGGSPLATSHAAVDPQRWQASLRTRYSPSVLKVPPGALIPDLGSIFKQSPGVIWPTEPGPPVDQLPVELIFGQELVVRTDSRSTLLLGAAAP